MDRRRPILAEDEVLVAEEVKVLLLSAISGLGDLLALGVLVDLPVRPLLLLDGGEVTGGSKSTEDLIVLGPGDLPPLGVLVDLALRPHPCVDAGKLLGRSSASNISDVATCLFPFSPGRRAENDPLHPFDLELPLLQPWEEGPLRGRKDSPSSHNKDSASLNSLPLVEGPRDLDLLLSGSGRTTNSPSLRLDLSRDLGRKTLLDRD